jgi:hypothetical protein
MLTEKVYAKVIGNYESLNSGSPAEAFDFILGVPSASFSNSDASTVNNNGTKAFAIIQDADKKNYIMDAICSDAAA